MSQVLQTQVEGEARVAMNFAIVHWPNTVLSRPIQAVIDMATTRMREICEQ